jgi:cyclase
MMDDATLNLEFVGGHSPGTILIHFVEGGVIFTGDNVEGNFPYFGQCQFFPWKETLRRILTIECEFIVPGHGPVGGREMVQRYLDFFQEIEEEVDDFRQKGFSPKEMVQKSRAIGFFPHEEELTWGWREEQYRIIAGKILEEIHKGERSDQTL